MKRGKANPERDEQELIAFHLGEPCDERAVRRRMEQDPGYAELSASVSHTLRVFSATLVPAPDADAAWQRLRPTLPLQHAAPAPQRWWQFSGLPSAAAALLALTILALVLPSAMHRGRSTGTAPGRLEVAGGGAGQGVDAPSPAEHLDRAERWLTTVNHTGARLDATTRAEGHRLLARNALYLQEAHTHGDLPDAAALERLDRVLTAARHPSESGFQLRLEMNTEGLLFDLRILRQNRSTNIGDAR